MIWEPADYRGASFGISVRRGACAFPRRGAMPHIRCQASGSAKAQKTNKHREIDEVEFSFLVMLPFPQTGNPVPIYPQVFRLDLRLGVRVMRFARLGIVIRTLSPTHHALKAPMKFITKVTKLLKIGSFPCEHHAAFGLVKRVGSITRELQLQLVEISGGTSSAANCS
jgi:hypothetical protein